jgi:hypothetical protein
LGIFNRGATGAGALVGAVAGSAAVVVLYVVEAPVTGLLYAFIGFGVCVFAGSLASLLARGK